MPEQLVVVGASLAGLRGAEAARRAGFDGLLTIVGEEPHLPYDRPPLSKRVLTGEIAVDRIGLPNIIPLDADWRLGRKAMEVDLSSRSVALSDGSRLPFDKLLIASGARARPWTDPVQAKLAGVFTLRDRDDAGKIRAALSAGPKHVLIIGGGFIGCEAASCCRELDLPVTVVDPNPTPLARVMGTGLGKRVAALLTGNGVDLRMTTTVTELDGDKYGRVRQAHLSDGSAIEADLVIVALGVLRDTAWLENSNLQADPKGVACDGFCRVLDRNGIAVEGIFAAGDVARWPHPLYDGRMVTLEHWGNAVEQGAFAGQAIAARSSPDHPYDYLPAFWSSQFGINIKSVGLADFADQMAVVQGNVGERRFIAAFGRDGRTVAAFSFDSARWLPAYAECVLARAPFPPIRGGNDQPDIRIVSPGFPVPKSGRDGASGTEEKPSHG